MRNPPCCGALLCNSARSGPLPVTALCKPQISGLKMSKVDLLSRHKAPHHGSGGGSSSTGVVMTGNNRTAGHNEHETPLRMSSCGTDVPYYRRCIGRRSLVQQHLIAGGSCDSCTMCIACASDTPSLLRPNDARFRQITVLNNFNICGALWLIYISQYGFRCSRAKKSQKSIGRGQQCQR